MLLVLLTVLLTAKAALLQAIVYNVKQVSIKMMLKHVSNALRTAAPVLRHLSVLPVPMD